MTVPVQDARRVISGIGWANPLTHTFPLENLAHLRVWADNVELVSGVDYSVSGVGDPSGYAVTITNPSDWSPAFWALEVSYPVDQPSDVSGGGRFGAQYEGALDRMARGMQTIADQIRRSVKGPATLPLDLDLEIEAPKALNAVRWDATGRYLENAGEIREIETLAAIAQQIVIVAGIRDEVVDVAGNEANINTVAGVSTAVAALGPAATSIVTLAPYTGELTDLAPVAADIGQLGPVAADVAALAPYGADIDTLAPYGANIATVAGIASHVVTVANNSARVTTVANSIASVNAVAANVTNVQTVAGSIASVNTVASIAANVTTVAGISAAVSSVAGNATNINAVHANKANIDNVAGNKANIDTVAGIAAAVASVAGNEANINAVHANKANIDTVAGIAADVSAVAAIDSDVVAVHGNEANINIVAANIALVGEKVSGPASAINNRIAVFDGATGKIIKDGGNTIADIIGSIGGGDMTAAVYDPGGVAGDAFSMDNMADGSAKVAMTAAERTKLGNVATGADVTAAGNVGAAIHGTSGKSTPVDADAFALIDSAASNALAKVTFADLKAAVAAYADTLYLRPSQNLGDVADAATAFGNIKQAATTGASGAVQLATAAEFRAGQDSGKALTPAVVYGDHATLTDAATIAVDMSTGYDFGGASGAPLALAGNRTLGAPTALRAGKKGLFVFTATGATRSLTLDPAYQLLEGVEEGPYLIDAGSLLFIAYVTVGSNVYVTGVLRK